MRPYRRLNFSLAVLIIAGLTALSTISTQSVRPKSSDRRPQIDRNQFPIVDYDAPEPSNEEQRTRRRAKSKKYNQSPLEVNPSASGDVTVSTHSELELLPALPLNQSDAIVIGTVNDAQAYLSSDKTGVYSEFTIRLGEILKDDRLSPLPSDSSIVAARQGGQVRFPSGSTHLYFNSKARMPRVGRRYLFFLKRTDEQQYFDLLTGYELRAGKVYPLDELKQFSSYMNVDESTFLNEIRNAVKTSSTLSAKQEERKYHEEKLSPTYFSIMPNGYRLNNSSRYC